MNILREQVHRIKITEKKASLVQREVARQRRDGGIVKVEIRAKTIPQSASLTAPFTQESLRL